MMPSPYVSYWADLHVQAFVGHPVRTARPIVVVNLRTLDDNSMRRQIDAPSQGCYAGQHLYSTVSK
jgi:hypothetical protein